MYSISSEQKKIYLKPIFFFSNFRKLFFFSSKIYYKFRISWPFLLQFSNSIQQHPCHSLVPHQNLRTAIFQSTAESAEQFPRLHERRGAEVDQLDVKLLV